MGIRDDLRGLAYGIRAIAGDPFQIRPYTVTVVTRTWAGDVVGEGDTTTAETAITEAGGQPPKVRFLSDEELALGSGLGDGNGLPRGSVEVGPITPDHSGGGTAFSTLTGGGTDPGDAFYYVLVGPDCPSPGRRYRLVKAHSDRALHYRVVLEPLSANA